MSKGKFSEVGSYPNFKEIADRWLAYWEEGEFVNRLMEKNSNGPNYSFIDGPITANNPMGVHHAWGRTLKDVIQRFKALQGFNQRLQNGFDCQGLWVEVETEKDLGLKTKKDIEDYGLENFSRKCRERVMKYADIIEQQSKVLGQWMDWPNSYFTMSDENIQSIWHFLKVCNENDMLYKGARVMQWCARCGTSLSQHELMDSYREMVHKAIYLKFPIVGEENRFFLVWTTTPWTLSSNVAIAVHSDERYVEVSNHGDKLILAEDAVAVLDGETEVLNVMMGSELEGMKYKGPFDELKAQKGVKHTVLLWDEVGAEEGTGIVHIAPGCGQEDYELGLEHDLPAICPIDENGVFLEGFEPLTGKSVFETNEEIFENLEQKGIVYKIHDYEHRYPECWRCHEEIVFRLVNEWFLAVPKLRDLMLEETHKVNWKPGFGEKLMDDWLNALGDWCISRKRYWGLPLPFYVCKNDHFQLISSKEELLEKAVNKDAELPELHRPWIDDIRIGCSECDEKASRVREVGDCWLDAGIVPYSTLDYGHDRDFWEKWFPSELVLEMREQVRLWFYSLLVMSCVLEKRAPFNSVVMYERVVDENGDAMHRSKGNVIWFDEAIEKMGADVMRWVYSAQNPRFDLRFGYGAAKQPTRLLSILWNVYRFFITYASVDKPDLDPSAAPKSDDVLDQWMISRLNSSLASFTDRMEKFEVSETTKILDGLIQDLANWYIRRSRRRFWKAESSEQKKQAYDVLYHILITTTKMLAPLTPFLSEEIYQNLVRSVDKSSPESVHLTDFPIANADLIDEKLEEDMLLLRRVTEIGLSVRAENNLKTRQPLAKARVFIDDADLRENLRDILQEELNIKEYDESFWGDFAEEDYEGHNLKVLLDSELTKELKDEGFVRELVRRVQRLRKEKDLHVEDKIRLFVEDETGTVVEVLDQWQDYLKRETLAEEVRLEKHDDLKTYRIGEKDICIAIEKLS
jgi:isoleucyl-tRNA synthetase